MSYDIYLRDPVTGETAGVPGHLMVGGTFRAEYHPETGTFTPALNTEAHLNITYNYGSYYYEAAKENGIRSIYGMTGGDSIAVLEKMIKILETKYKINEEWIYTKRDKTIYLDEKGNVIKDPLDAIIKELPVEKKKITVDRYEGPARDYWEPTAANAIKPLYQLIALAKMRPDCVWDGD